MADKYLDANGVTYLWEQIETELAARDTKMPFMITITPVTETTGTMDHTIAEIKTAANAGRPLIAKMAVPNIGSFITNTCAYKEDTNFTYGSFNAFIEMDGNIVELFSNVTNDGTNVSITYSTTPDWSTTTAEKAIWNAKYAKPSDGIPASDLASGVIPDNNSHTMTVLLTGLNDGEIATTDTTFSEALAWINDGSRIDILVPLGSLHYAVGTIQEIDATGSAFKVGAINGNYLITTTLHPNIEDEEEIGMIGGVKITDLDPIQPGAFYVPITRTENGQYETSVTLSSCQNAFNNLSPIVAYFDDSTQDENNNIIKHTYAFMILDQLDDDGIVFTACSSTGYYCLVLQPKETSSAGMTGSMTSSRHIDEITVTPISETTGTVSPNIGRISEIVTTGLSSIQILVYLSETERAICSNWTYTRDENYTYGEFKAVFYTSNGVGSLTLPATNDFDANTVVLSFADLNFVSSTDRFNWNNKVNSTDLNNYVSITDLPNYGIGSYYGTCSTAAATSAKIVTCQGFTLTAGNRITIKFINGQTASSMTLNVNGTGAVTVNKPSRTTMVFSCVANDVKEFVYDGSNFIMVNGRSATTSYPGLVQLDDTTTSISTTLAPTAKALKTTYDLVNNALKRKIYYVDSLPAIPTYAIESSFEQNAIYLVRNNNTSGDLYDAYIFISNQKKITGIPNLNLTEDPLLINNSKQDIADIWIDNKIESSINLLPLNCDLNFYSEYDDEGEEWINLDHSPLTVPSSTASGATVASLSSDLINDINAGTSFYVDVSGGGAYTSTESFEMVITYDYNSYWQKISNIDYKSPKFFSYKGSIGNTNMTPGTSVTITDANIQQLGNSLSGYATPEIGDYLIGTDGSVAFRVAGTGSFASGDYQYYGCIKHNEYKGEIWECSNSIIASLNPGIVAKRYITSSLLSNPSIYSMARKNTMPSLAGSCIDINFGLKFKPSTSAIFYSHVYTVTDTINGLYVPPTVNGSLLFLKGTVTDGRFIIDSTEPIVADNANLSNQTDSYIYWNFGSINSTLSTNYYLELYEGKMWQIISYDGNDLTAQNRVIPYTGLTDILRDLANYNFA